MKTAKQQAIEKAYGETWRYIDLDIQQRILSVSGWTYELNDKFYEQYFPLERDKSIFRPLSLKGLETNNGWIRIESEEDLPTNGSKFKLLLNDKSIIEVNNIHVIRSYLKQDGLSYATHYKPIEKELLPIY